MTHSSKELTEAHEALETVIKTLEPFDSKTQDRILRTVAIFFEVKPE